MRFDTSQHMRLGQQMRLAPRMIQSMEILQMPLTELEERIEQELESNAALEVVEPERPEGQEDSREEDRAARESERPLSVDDRRGGAEFERLDSYEQSHPDAAENEFSERPEERPSREAIDPGESFRPRQDGERDAKMDAMAAAPARAASLVEQLREQWGLADAEPALRRPGDLLISFLDADGYLRTPLDVVADRAPAAEGEARPTVEVLERALRALQLFLDPPGIAARDTRECLLLQLDALGAGPEAPSPPVVAAARLLIAEHLTDLLKNRLPRVAERSHLSLDEIKGALALMRRLSLSPASQLVSESNPAVVPDAVVEYDTESDRYFAYLNDSRLPNLQVNREYARMAKDRSVEKKDRDFLKVNIGNAQWLIDAVNQRRHTLLRVIGVVIEAQREFFDFGPQALKPLPMTQVAEQLGVHVATVSRAVADKHLVTPRGVVALRKFFSGGTQTDSGEEMSWDAIRNSLREVVDAEDKGKPLSDEAIVDALKVKGIEIARRTVAKYRDQLQIPSARMRKTF